MSEVAELNVKVGEAFADAVIAFLGDRRIQCIDVDGIGSHGQTIFHRVGAGVHCPATLQIGSPSIIAERTGIITIANFRERDLAVGGLGAPLVPILDYVLFHQRDRIVAYNNLGSISNVTVVTPALVDVFAFDTGPANMPIDFFAKQAPGNQSGIDIDGSLSSRGRVIPELLQALVAQPFFMLPPPKAAGYAEFGPPLLEVLARPYSHAPVEDLVATAVEFSARTIASAYERFVFPRAPSLSEITFTGGGARNPTLMHRIKSLFPSQCTIGTMATTDAAFSDAKEAVLMALLANETLCGRPGNIPNVTGASRPVVLGTISL